MVRAISATKAILKLTSQYIKRGGHFTNYIVNWQEFHFIMPQHNK